MGFVHRTHSCTRLAPVDELATDAALEEATTAVASVDAVVLATACVCTHLTQKAAGQHFTWRWTLTSLAVICDGAAW